MAGLTKKEIVELLAETATLLEFHGANSFKSRAFEAASRALAAEAAPLDELVSEPGRLETIRGIGKSIATVIRQAAETGTADECDELRVSTPPGIFELLQVPNLGPKKLRALYTELGIDSLDSLEKACTSGAVAALKGFGEKTAANLLTGVGLVRRHAGKYLLPVALKWAAPLLEAVRECPATIRAEVAGSLRRRKEIVGDIDILAASERPGDVMEAFLAAPSVRETIAQGPTKSSVRLANDMQADLRVVAESEYAAALQYFTGSKEHNTQLRGRAKRMGLLVNEYGVFRHGPAVDPGQSDREGERLLTAGEDDVYAALGLPPIPPELREGMGEIEAAEGRSLPRLVERSDYLGALHCHTTWSDGTASVIDMARAARDTHGMQYLAVTDHSEAAVYASGVGRDRIPAQHADIDRANEALAPLGFRVLKGCECDIQADGSLDYPDDVLASMDIVVASIHSRFQMSEADMTLRIIRAVENPFTAVLGHPTGRILLGRDPYAVDIEAVLRRAAECGTVIEINGDPNRLDLDWRLCRRAKEMGVVFSVNPDAHSIEGLRAVDWGLDTARKGWLEKGDILNCLPLDALLERLKRLRESKRGR